MPDEEFDRLASDIHNRYKSSSLTVPTGEETDQSSSIYRMHEVTVRVTGPRQPDIRLTHTIAPTWVSTAIPHVATNNVNVTDLFLPVTESLSQTERLPSAYEYLFTERFSLLQLLGAVIGLALFVHSSFVLRLSRNTCAN
ncbi:unnamed protein product [Echinostoma caproni]|uniref:COPIIcoated_ERV domain-containing protein n=1 Tax=Echinostoma caproni TaxID=27848 RepID=A0A183AYL4_9TREM|nr:unnamed protein product [Echinostoma caproni]